MPQIPDEAPRPAPSPLDLVRWKLQWCADGEWRIPFTPDECCILLDALPVSVSHASVRHDEAYDALAAASLAQVRVVSQETGTGTAGDREGGYEFGPPA